LILRKEANQVSALPSDYTYTLAKGRFIACSLRVEVKHPDSMSDFYIEILARIAKHTEIYQPIHIFWKIHPSPDA